MNKSVLIVTPYFAPQSHAAVFRAHKLAKYLPRFGWKPHVLTVATNYLYNEDAALRSDLPPEVVVSTTKYIEPTMRGVRMALGGRDRTFNAQKDVGAVNINESLSSTRTCARSLARSAYQYVRESWLSSPDAHWTWYRFAVREARRIINTEGIPLVYTSCLPFTSNRIGLTLQHEGVRWVADFRDPPAYSIRMSSPVDRVYMKQRRIERDTLQQADAVTTTSSAYEMIFRDMHGPNIRDTFHFIPTGLDDDYIGEPNAGHAMQQTYIVFAGEYLAEYGDTFLQIFARALDDPELRQLGIRLLVIGRREVNVPLIRPILARLGITESVEFRDHVRQPELYAILRSARAGLLIPGPTSHWWTNFAKMVDYIALRLPCLALVPDPSEARSQLSKAGLGVFLDGDRDTAAQTLINFLLGHSRELTPNSAECDRYLASTQVQSFVNVFESLIHESAQPDNVNPAGRSNFHRRS